MVYRSPPFSIERGYERSRYYNALTAAGAPALVTRQPPLVFAPAGIKHEANETPG